MQISFVGFQPVQSSEHMAVSFTPVIYVLNEPIKSENNTVACSKLV